MLNKNVGKATFRGTNDTAETELDTNVALNQQLANDKDNQHVIWFKVGSITTENSKNGFCSPAASSAWSNQGDSESLSKYSGLWRVREGVITFAAVGCGSCRV